MDTLTVTQITELIKYQQEWVSCLADVIKHDEYANESKIDEDHKQAEAVLQALCSVRWIMTALNTRTAQVEELKQALSECLQVTKSWHCMGMTDSMAEACWNSYKKDAPEMASIMAVVAKHAKGKEAYNG